MGKSWKQKNKWYDDEYDVKNSRRKQNNQRNQTHRSSKEDRLDEFIKEQESEAYK